MQQEFPSFNSKHPGMAQFFIRNYIHDLTVYKKHTQYRSKKQIMSFGLIYNIWGQCYLELQLYINSTGVLHYNDFQNKGTIPLLK